MRHEKNTIQKNKFFSAVKDCKKGAEKSNLHKSRVTLTCLYKKFKLSSLGLICRRYSGESFFFSKLKRGKTLVSPWRLIFVYVMPVLVRY